MFSVIIPLYNKEKDVAKTLKSLLEQDFGEFEAIVINDGSTDNGASIVESFSDTRIKLYHTENRGLPSARNLGVKYSKYDYLTFLDADDLWNSDYLSTLKEMIDKYPSESWYGTSYSVITKKGREFPCVMYNKWEKDWCGVLNDFFIINRAQWLVNMCTICVRRNLFDEIGGFDESMDYEEDIDFYIRLALRVPIVYCNSITMLYNMQGANRISDDSFVGKKTLDWKKFQKEEEQYEDLKKFLDFFRYMQYVKYKLLSDYDKAKVARDGIDKSNLTKSQRVLIEMPHFLLVLGMKFKEKLSEVGLDFHLTKG